MLNPFPIQFLALFAYFLLRAFVGGVLLYLGSQHLRNRTALTKIPAPKTQTTLTRATLYTLIFCEIIGGITILLGAYTQYGALLVLLYALFVLISNPKKLYPTLPSRLFYTLLFGASLSLFITGAGVFAFDLPI